MGDGGGGNRGLDRAGVVRHEGVAGDIGVAVAGVVAVFDVDDDVLAVDVPDETAPGRGDTPSGLDWGGSDGWSSSFGPCPTWARTCLTGRLGGETSGSVNLVVGLLTTTFGASVGAGSGV